MFWSICRVVLMIGFLRRAICLLKFLTLYALALLLLLLLFQFGCFSDIFPGVGVEPCGVPVQRSVTKMNTSFLVGQRMVGLYFHQSEQL